MFGNGVWTNMVLPTTSGSPSCPRSTPVENDHATLRSLTFSVVIWLTVLYRVADGFLLGIAHSLSPPGADANARLSDDEGVALVQAGAQARPAAAITMNSHDEVFICTPCVSATR